MTSPERPVKSARVLASICTLILLGLLAVMTVLEVRSLLLFPHMDFGIYYEASMALRTGDDMFGAYEQAPLTYIYPPLLAILFLPLTYLPIQYAAAVWAVTNLGLLLACLWFGGRLLLDHFDARLDVATLPVLLLLSVIYFQPRIDAEFDQGQVDFLVLLGIIGSLAVVHRYPLLAGLLLGLVANIKYQTVIFLPYFLIRGWWSTAIGFVSGAIAFALSGALVIGWSTNLDYLKRGFSGLGSLVGLPAVEGPQPFIFPIEWGESISLTSTFARWTNVQQNGESMTFLLVLITGVVCAVVGWALYASQGVPLFSGRGGSFGRTSREHRPLVTLEWIGLMVAAIAFAPQTKMRHLALLLFLVMAGVILLIVPRQGVRRMPLLITMIILFLVLVMPPPFDESWKEGRKWFRREGLPMLCILIMYFVVLWTSLRSCGRGFLSDRNIRHESSSGDSSEKSDCIA
jgi:alpha-1,2-mannosyltransferase